MSYLKMKTRKAHPAVPARPNPRVNISQLWLLYSADWQTLADDEYESDGSFSNCGMLPRATLNTRSPSACTVDEADDTEWLNQNPNIDVNIIENSMRSLTLQVETNAEDGAKLNCLSEGALLANNWYQADYLLCVTD